MKRSVLINLICSMIATLVVLIGVLLVLVLTGNVEFEQKKLVISSASATAVYDGKTLSNNKWYLVEGELDEGHTISASVTGSQTSVGMSENYVTAKILDESGKDVTKKYAIEYRPGALQVRARELVIVADSKMKAYDSLPLVCAGYTLKSAAALMPGDQLRVTVEGSITEVGEVPNEITDYTITNERGQDTSRNYNVTLINGRLVVYDEETLVIETDSDTKVYDGAVLRNDNWTLTSGALQPNHSIKVMVIGAQLSAGNSENSFSVMIYDGNGVNVTDTYEIVSVPGTLVVSRAPVTVKSNSAEKAYDGSPLTEDGFEVSPAYLTERGFRFEPVITGSQTEEGSSSNTVQSCTVYDPAGNDVTANFDISFSEGELTVTDREEYLSPTSLVFQSGEATKIYDGAPLTNSTWELVSGSLQEGHTAEVEMTGAEQTDAGSCDNTYTVVIRDAAGQNVTAEYDLTLNYGTLTVNPLEITVQAKNAQKVYDATPLTADGCVVRPQHLDLTSKFDFEWQVIGSRIEIGESDNTVAYCRIYDEDGRDITHNFSIKKVVGTLRVVANEDELRTEITYSSGSASKTYDGTPLSCYEYELIEGELRDGHDAVPQFKTSEITKVGKVDNDFEVRIYDEETNEDVTDRYLIDYEFGTLEIFPKEITVTAGDAEKMYDGMPLEYGGFSVGNTDSSDPSEPLGEGDKIAADMDGSAFKEGDRVSNKVSSVTITNADGEDVTDCYKITTSDGTLSVTGPTGREIFRLTAIGQNPRNGIYLKQQSYGDYDPEAKRWSSAKTYDVQIGDGKSAYYLPGEVCRANSIGLSEMDIAPVGGVFALPYYAETGEFDVQADDTRIVGETAQDYTVFYYDHNQYIIDRHAVRDAEWVAFEQEYALFVKNNYRSVDPETLAFMESIIAARGFDRMSDEDAIRAVAQYLQNPIASGLSYDMQYDRTIDQASNPVIAFMQTGKGVCRHYAQAATLMYRALGIPARYTVGFSAPGFTPDGLSTVTDREAHAWVEVYKSGIGWVWVEVTGGPMQTMKLTVEPTYTSQQYDRYDPAELFADQTVSGLNELTGLGYTYEAEISGSRTEPGKTESEILQLVIRDPSGDEVYNKRSGTGSTLFEITYKTGTVHVYWSELMFVSQNREYIYDGAAHGDASVDDITFVGTLESEHHWDVRDLKKVTNFKDATDNSFSVTIVDAVGRSVYDEYKITQKFGKLKITPKEVWVTTKTVICTEAELAALGGNLTCHEFESIEGLLDGHELFCEFIGVQAEKGSSLNLVDRSKGKVVVKDRYGNDVTSNYSIVFEWGQLIVT